MKLDQAQSLIGRHAVVTGGGRGLGVAIAEALVQRGAAVSLVCLLYTSDAADE